MVKKSFVAVGAATLLCAGWFLCVPRQQAKASDPEVYCEPKAAYCVISAKPKEEAFTGITLKYMDLRTIERKRIGLLPVIETKKEETEESKDPLYSEEELEMMACVIYQEAGGDEASDDIRRMVGEVVLNRVADPRFPDTIEEVLLQKSQYGRFHWTGIIWPSRAAKEPEAVERAYICARMVFEEERLLPTDVIFQSEFIQGKEVIVHVPGFYFCR